MPRPPNTTLQEALKSSLSRSPRAGQLDVSTEALEGTRSRLVALAPGEPSELYLRYCRNFPDNEPLRQWCGIFMIVQTRSHIRRFHHPTLQIDRIHPVPRTTRTLHQVPFCEILYTHRKNEFQAKSPRHTEFEIDCPNTLLSSEPSAPPR